MSKSSISREAFVAAMKRKDVKILGGVILREIFKQDEDQIKELESASRITVALIDRTCLAAPTEELDKATGAKEIVGGGDTPHESGKGGAVHGSAAIVDIDKETVGSIKELIKAGTKKSLKQAKKALESQFDEDHPNYADLAKKIKKAKKALK